MIKNILDVEKIFSKNDIKIYGIGVTSFMRIIPALFLNKNFEIICYKNSLDNKIFQKITKIHSIQKTDENIEKLNTLNILKSKLAINLLNKNDNIYIYKNDINIQKLAIEKGYNIIGNKSEIRDIYENKKYFREILQKNGIEAIYGENTSYELFISKNYDFFVKKYGNKIVIQLPDILSGGGLGTIFINNEDDFLVFKEKIKNKLYRDTIINTLNITKFISGISASITGCCTRYGTLSTKIQTQIVDIPEVINLNKGSGLFCGHDWSFKKYNDALNIKAQNIVEKIGDYMYKNGYKGIFGLDLIIDEVNNNLYVVECNPRYTGAFPMISMIDVKNNLIPMDIFHILEFLDIDYKINFEEINLKYKYDKNGSHIILSNKENIEITIKKDLLPGIYTFLDDKILYLREGFNYSDLQKDEEFIIIDGNPKIGEKIRGFGELSRFCHLLFPISIMENHNELNEKTKKIIKEIYKIYT